MKDDYIRKADAKDALQEKVFHNLTDEFYGAMQVLDELEPADVVQVCRCRDCKYFYEDIGICDNSDALVYPTADGFCSYGEREE